MSTAIRSLEQLQQELDNHSGTGWLKAAVSFSEADGLIAVEFFGYQGELERLFETLCLPEVARALGALSFAGEDEGANGSNEWDFTPLLKQEVVFPNLHTLAIELLLEQSNHPIVGDGLEENGQLARWLDYNAPGKLDRGISYNAVSEPRRKERSWRHSETTTAPSSRPR
jgi:hypothetical protein